MIKRTFDTTDFVRESNRIEGVLRDPTSAEIDEHIRFMCLRKVEVADLVEFVSVYQPNARLRNRVGLNVRVGEHIPPPGGPDIEQKLESLLSSLSVYKTATLTPYQMHCVYETLHPFTDGNGRSGRALWAWQMQHSRGGYPLGFLHHFYYQALRESRL